MTDEPEFGDQYRLLWQKPKTKCVGEIRNYTIDGKGYRSIHILLDDDLMNKINMRFIACNWDNSGPKIYVSNIFMSLSQQLREAGLWHEVGHIHYEHHFRDDVRDQAQVRKARISAVKKGQVMPHEKEADQFAVTHAGKDSYIAFLQYVISTRPTGGKFGWNEMGRRELEIRIAAIQDL